MDMMTWLVLVGASIALAFLFVPGLSRWIATARGICTVIVLGIITAISVCLSAVDFWLGAISAVVLTSLFALSSIKDVPAEPPHKAVLVCLGRRLKTVLREGWHWMPLFPLIFRFVLVKVVKVDHDIPKLEMRTPDRALVRMGASVTWIPGYKDEHGNDDPESYLTYLNSGEEPGVNKILSGIIEDRIKTWASSNREGPAGWEEAQGLRDDAHQVLSKALLGEALGKIDSPIPTSVWMRFLDSPQSVPTAFDAAKRPDEKPWAEKEVDVATGELKSWNWNGLKAIFTSLTPEQQEALKNQVEARRQAIFRLREGNAEFPQKGLGITIVRFTIGELMVGGAVADAADQAEKEKKEREADVVEVQNIADRITGLRRQHPEMSLEEAARTVLISMGKIRKSVFEVLGAATGLGQDFLAGLGARAVPSDEPRTRGTKGGNGGNLPPPPPGML